MHYAMCVNVRIIAVNEIQKARYSALSCRVTVVKWYLLLLHLLCELRQVLLERGQLGQALGSQRPASVGLFAQRVLHAVTLQLVHCPRERRRGRGWDG